MDRDDTRLWRIVFLVLLALIVVALFLLTIAPAGDSGGDVFRQRNPVTVIDNGHSSSLRSGVPSRGNLRDSKTGAHSTKGDRDEADRKDSVSSGRAHLPLPSQSGLHRKAVSLRSYRFPGLATNGGGTTCGPGIGDDGADSAEYRKDADPDQELECAIAFLTIKSENQEHRTLYQRGQLAGYNLVRIFLTRSDGDAQSEEELVGETGASHFETVKLLPTSDEMRIVFKLPGPASIYQDLDWSYLRNSFTLKRDKDSADRERYPLSPEILSGGLIDLGTFIPIQ